MNTSVVFATVTSSALVVICDDSTVGVMWTTSVTLTEDVVARSTFALQHGHPSATVRDRGLWFGSLLLGLPTSAPGVRSESLRMLLDLVGIGAGEGVHVVTPDGEKRLIVDEESYPIAGGVRIVP